MENVTYKSSGVDIEEGQKAVNLMKNHVRETFNSSVLDQLGGFGGLFALDLEDIAEPVLVSGTDGVGTKLRLAFLMDKHDTIGQDCVAMCVNDIICQGARPLFFLDYIATGKLRAQKAESIVKGIVVGCKKSNMALIGGETAEMPGFYQGEDYDIAGFAVGIADKSKIITGETIGEGDIVIGLESSGLHSNGFSLARKVLLEGEESSLDSEFDDTGKSLGELLISPTKIYVKPVMSLLKDIGVKGIAHITGGGFYENIPRILPDNTLAKIGLGSWEIPKIFKHIQTKGNIEDREMFTTFNMGIGMVVVVSKEDADRSISILSKAGEKAYKIGEIQRGERSVVLCQE